MHENMTFAIGKLIFVSYPFVFRCFPPLDLRSPLDYEMATYIHNISKGHLGSWGEIGL